MNETLIKMLVKSIGPGKIEEIATQIGQKLISAKDNVQLQPGENDTILIMFTDNQENIFVSIATVDTTHTPPALKRQISTWPVKELVKKFIQNL